MGGKPINLFGTLLIAALLMAGQAWSHSLKGSEKKFSVYHLHPYPICFYDTDLGAVKAARELWKTYPNVLEKTVMDKARKQTSFVVANSHMALIRTTLNHHRELLNIWPKIACVGRTGGASSAGAYRICTKYMEEYIRSQIQHIEMKNDTIEPICQTFLPEVN